jgi:phage N-6-adenine-methyltransferase
MNHDALFSSTRQDWATPRWLFDGLDTEFGFDLDAAASPDNALCERYLTEADNALNSSWQPARAAWVNPPYTRANGGLNAWLATARTESALGTTVVMLVPARTDAGWWTRHALHANEIRFIAGRLRFEGATEPAPFPSAILVYRPMRSWAGPRGTTYTVRRLAQPVVSYIERTAID